MTLIDDDDVYHYTGERLKLEGETENIGVCTKERQGITAEVLMATPLCWKFATVSWSRAAGGRRS